MKILKLSDLAARSADSQVISPKCSVEKDILPATVWYLPIGQTGLIILDFSRLLVYQEDVAMQTYNNSYEITL